MTEISKYQLISPKHWSDYELIDSGNFEKLERFGKLILSRPEPQAIWNKSLSEEEWSQLYDSRFIMDVKNHNGEKGMWRNSKKIPSQWHIKYKHDKLELAFILKFNTFKHIGIFPEQADNWDFIFKNSISIDGEQKKILNLFAYTGGASLAAAAAGAKVFHVDSVKQVVNHANENMQLSGLNGVHWIIEDALKYIQREQRRNNKYDGIILDPPAFGRGPNGEKWILEKHLNELLKICSDLLKSTNSFLVLNLYSLGLSALISDNLIKSHFGNINSEYGEIYLDDRFEKKLPLGTFVRFKR